MIDTHCHLTFPDFDGRTDDVLAEARRHGVTGVITISTTSQDCRAALEIACRHDRVWSTSGVHPLYADRGEHDWNAVLACAQDPRCVAWGELGLDRHYPDPPLDRQRRVLADQIAVIESARDTAGRPGLGKPVVIHCREAFDELIPVLRSSEISPDRCVFHCFTGGAAEARAVLDFGAMLSFTGVVTYRNAREVRAAAAIVPLDRLMCETDAPYLSPEPKRGVRPCEPWMASLTARFLAQLRGEAWDAFHHAINRNTERFFGIDPGEGRDA
ncbi:MAG: TatD family hydrolase [Phycisphaerales bacterium]